MSTIYESGGLAFDNSDLSGGAGDFDFDLVTGAKLRFHRGRNFRQRRNSGPPLSMAPEMKFPFHLQDPPILMDHRLRSWPPPCS